MRFQALRVVDSAQPIPEKWMGLNSASLGSARRGLGTGLGGTRQRSEPSRGSDGDGRGTLEEAEGTRKSSRERSGGEARRGTGRSLQINFAPAKAARYLLFLNMHHKLG